MIKIGIFNNKGGVGKTTSVINLAGYFSDLGFKVLLGDFDPQGNLTLGLGVDNRKIKTAYDILQEYSTMFIGETDPTKYVIKVPDLLDENKDIVNVRNIDIIPSNLTLERANLTFSSEFGKDQMIANALKDLSKNYEICIIDVPPSLSFLTTGSLIAVDYAFIPVKTGYFELVGSQVLIDTINMIKRQLNPNLKVGGVFITQLDSRNNLTKQMLEELYNTFGDLIMESKIKSSIAVAEALSLGQTIFEYKPNSNAAKEYKDWAKEVAKVIGIKAKKKKGVKN